MCWQVWGGDDFLKLFEQCILWYENGLPFENTGAPNLKQRNLCLEGDPPLIRHVAHRISVNPWTWLEHTWKHPHVNRGLEWFAQHQARERGNGLLLKSHKKAWTVFVSNQVLGSEWSLLPNKCCRANQMWSCESTFYRCVNWPVNLTGTSTGDFLRPNRKGTNRVWI